MLPQVKGGAKAKSQTKTRKKTAPRQDTVDLKAIRDARAALHDAETRHRHALATLETERGALEQRMEDVEEKWRREKRDLEAEIARLKR